MGLDMYFYARQTKYKSYGAIEKDAGENDETDYPKSLAKFGELLEEDCFKSLTVEKYWKVGYFRKFNALHNWIVKNLADGVDECQRIFISRPEAVAICSVLKFVKDDHSLAPSKLPTASGCFFGSTEYDEWYFKDVEEALRLFNAILADFDFDEYDLVYGASW